MEWRTYTITIRPWTVKKALGGYQDWQDIGERIKSETDHLARRSLLVKYLRLGYQVRRITPETLEV